jgi:hypothetical protein
MWSKKDKRWVGEHYGLMGKIAIFWDETVEKITEWTEI